MKKMKKIDMRKDHWLDLLLDDIQQQIDSTSETDFEVEVEDSGKIYPTHEGGVQVELINIRFPFRIFEPCQYDPDAVAGFSGLFQYIRNYEETLDKVTLFEDEWGQQGIKFRPVLSFQTHQDFGSEPEKQPLQWATISYTLEEV
jgi:hypothetical protein